MHRSERVLQRPCIRLHRRHLARMCGSQRSRAYGCRAGMRIRKEQHKRTLRLRGCLKTVPAGAADLLKSVLVAAFAFLSGEASGMPMDEELGEAASLIAADVSPRVGLHSQEKREEPQPSSGAAWWRGSLHTHNLWSDGDSYPELIVSWYKENGYHFLALSDPNILSKGQKWIHPEKHRYLRGRGEAMLRDYREKFGERWVGTRLVDEEFHRWLYDQGARLRRPGKDEVAVGDTVVRLKPLNEFRPLFEELGKFLLLQSEELSSGTIHVNATNLIERLELQSGDNFHLIADSSARPVRFGRSFRSFS